LLPIEIDPKIILIQKKSIQKPFTYKTRINVQDKILDKTYFQLNESFIVEKWQDEVTPDNLLKSLKIKLKVNSKQRQIFNEWFNTSNYVYNKTISCIKDGEPINFMNLRNKLVTANTKKNDIEYVTLENNMKICKDEKKKQQKNLIKIPKNDIVNITAVNLLIQTAEEKYQEEKEKLKLIRKSLKSTKNIEIRDWETNTPKEIRAGAVNDVCKAYVSDSISTTKEHYFISKYHVAIVTY
jgi:Helix-turn-helix domain